jgi:hypothetical protein
MNVTFVALGRCEGADLVPHGPCGRWSELKNAVDWEHQTSIGIDPIDPLLR